eukprot:UN00320
MKFFAIAAIVFGLVNAGNILDTHYATDGDCDNYFGVELYGCVLSSSGCYGHIACKCVAGKHKMLDFVYYVEDDCSGKVVGRGNFMANGECNLAVASCVETEYEGGWRVDPDAWEAACEITDCN